MRFFKSTKLTVAACVLCVLGTTTRASADVLTRTYNAAALGDLPTRFERDAPTVDPLGFPVAKNERRFGPPVAACSAPEWRDAGVAITAAAADSSVVWDCGLDHDNETPMAIGNSASANEVRLYAGATPALVRSVPYSDARFGSGTYAPVGGRIWHGLILIWCERLSGGQVVGTSVLYSNDDLQTLAVLGNVGSLADIPANTAAAGADAGMSRGRTWSYSVFPAGGPGDVTQLEVCWADYIAKSNAPSGGQVGYFRASRPTPTGDWVVRPNRILEDIWRDPGAVNQLHSHGGAPCAAGVLSHWGDNGLNNAIRLHAFDRDAYETASVTTSEFFGGFTGDVTIHKSAPQPVAMVYGPYPGTHFGSTDENEGCVEYYGPVASATDRLEVRTVVPRRSRRGAGNGYDFLAPLHLHAVTGRGWVSGGVQDIVHHFSADGIHWGQLPRPSAGTQRVWIYGDSLLAVDDATKRIWLADLPKVTPHRPLAISPGGTNYLGEISQNQAVGSGNTLELIAYDAASGLWKFTADDSVVSPQPPALPAMGAPRVEVITAGATTRDFGRHWLQGATEPDVPHTLGKLVSDYRLTVLGRQGGYLSARTIDEFNGVSPTRDRRVHETASWWPMSERWLHNNGQFARRHRTQRWLAASSGDVHGGARLALALLYYGPSSDTPYPIAYQATGPAEIESAAVSLPSAGGWSLGYYTASPHDACLDVGEHVLLSLKSAAGTTHVQVLLDLPNQDDADLVVRVTNSGSVAAEASVALLRWGAGDSLDLALSYDASSVGVHARAGMQLLSASTATASVTIDADLTRLVYADAAESDVKCQHVSGLWLETADAWDASERAAWLHQSFAERSGVAVATAVSGDNWRDFRAD